MLLRDDPVNHIANIIEIIRCSGETDAVNIYTLGKTAQGDSNFDPFNKTGQMSKIKKKHTKKTWVEKLNVRLCIPLIQSS